MSTRFALYTNYGVIECTKSFKNKAAGIVTVIPRCCFKPEAELAKETGFSDSW